MLLFLLDIRKGGFERWPPATLPPPLKAGVTDHKWSIEEMVGLLPELHYNTRPKRDAAG